MADSRTYRVQFWMRSVAFVAILIGIIITLALFGNRVSRFKVDMTEDGVYTISPSFIKILKDLNERVLVTYYCSETLPSSLLNLRRDTIDMFGEIEILSDNKIEFKLVDPDREAKKHARKKVAEYKEAETDPEKDPEEPKPKQTFQDLFSGRQRTERKDEDIAAARRQEANAIANKTGQDADDVYYDSLQDDWSRTYLEELEGEGIREYRIRERRGSDIQTISFYSTMTIEYTTEEREIIPVHYQIQNLELELATNILRLSQKNKPVVAFFDARAPDVPPPNPFQQQQQGPRSDYEAVNQALSQLFDVRTVKLEEEDNLDTLRERLADEAKDSKKGSGQPATIDCFIIAQPDNLEERQVYEISKAVSEGIPTVFLVSRNSITIANGLRTGYPIEFMNPGLDDYLRSLGITVGRGILGSSYCSRLPALMSMGGVRMQGFIPFTVTVAASAVDGLLHESAGLTNGVDQLVFPATNGALVSNSRVEEIGLDLTRLAWTHEETWSTDVPRFSQGGMFNKGLQQPTLFQYAAELVEQPSQRRRMEHIDRRELAFLMKGKFPFYYEGKEIPEWEKKPEPEEDGAGGFPGGLPGGFPGGLPGGHPPVGGGSRGPVGSPQNPAPPGAQETPPAPSVPESAGPPVPAQTQTPPAVTPKNEAEETPPAVTPKSGAEETPPAVTPKSEAEETPPAVTPKSEAEETSPAVTPKNEAEETPPAVTPKSEAEETPPAVSDAEEADTESAVATVASVTPGEGKILFIASADFLKDRYFQVSREMRSNLQFAQTAIETFAMGKDLINIRRKTLTERHFKNADEDKQFYIQLVNFAALPLLLGAIGLIRFFLRRREANVYERQHQSGGNR